MPTDPRIDAYIARQADFARPILEHLRGIVREACPDCEETLKWSMPSFVHQGAILATMAAFKAHASFNLWRGADVLGDKARDGAMGQFGRIASIADLPPRGELIALVRQAMALAGEKKPARPARIARPVAEPPAELVAALAGNPAAQATFDAFPPGCRREYVDWVAEAKRPETRVKRAAQAAEWMAEGKRRNWKYERC
jgi:uncharacterized protein YdeI (YjbR/CyaY-like superfamily)